MKDRGLSPSGFATWAIVARSKMKVPQSSTRWQLHVTMHTMTL